MSSTPPRGETADPTRSARPVRIERALPLLRGTTVGRYVILDRIGAGGMGVVYRAYDPELDRAVALKLLRARDDARWLLREAQALARLQHPNVVAVHDVGTFQSDVFLAMELVEGESLRSWLKGRTRERGEVLAVFLAAGEGLAAAHRAGLVHRDFKPDNVIVGDDGRVRVLDFGLARSAGDTTSRTSRVKLSSRPPRPLDDPTLTDRDGPRDPTPLAALVDELDARSATSAPPPSRPSQHPSHHPSGSGNLLELPLTHADAIVGTPRYMAPEQHAVDVIDGRADQFSFCVSLYQVLYGAYPFGFDPAGPDRDWRVLDPPAGSTVPRWLRAVIVRGLAEKPADRWPSMNELLAALRADPRARWRKWWAIAAGVAFAGAIAAAWTTAQKSRVQECRGAETKLAGVWDDARRGAIQRAFARSGRPYQGAAFAAVARAFDDYAARWSAMHVDACEATRVRGEQSQELLDLRMACLADRASEMKALSDLFASADGAVVERAAQSAQSLPSLATCADAVALRAPIPPPKDARSKERADAVREDLARADAMEAAARFDDGLAIAKGALSEAESIAYAPLLAQARLRVGQLLGGRGDYAESARALHLAYVSALAGRDDDTATRAATDLIVAMGTRQAHYDEGDRWAEVAEALAGRLQQKDERLGALYSSRANLREREGKYDDAQADAERAIAIDERTLGPDSLALAEAWYHLGAVHYFKAEYTDALAAYDKCLAIQSRTVGPDHPVLLGARVGIADVYGDQGDHVRALAQYQSALAAILRVRPEDPDIPMVRNNMGGELQQLGRLGEAFEQYQLALDDWRKRIGPGKEVITALSNMGEVQLARHRPEEALRYYGEASSVCDASLGPEHHLCARLLWGVGESYRLLGRLADAQERYERSLAITEKALGPKHPQLTGPLIGVARIALSKGDAAKAKQALERTLAILGDDPGEGTTAPDAKFLLAQASWTLGDHARAKALADAARAGYEAAGTAATSELGDVAAWIAKHR